mmetsp:Transcript_47744/g.101461  ORF Transcript_47744/g.101461 Transcript_47744/m.101461 type:complete len:82 (+) Transcript_47744:307-552(+)
MAAKKLGASDNKGFNEIQDIIIPFCIKQNKISLHENKRINADVLAKLQRDPCSRTNRTKHGQTEVYVKLRRNEYRSKFKIR